MKIKMRQLSIFSFSLVIMVVLIIILVLIFQQNGVVSEAVVKNAESDFIDEISSRLDEYFDVPGLIINSQYSTFSQNLLDFDKDDEVAEHFSYVINSLPINIYSFTYGTQQGTFYGARRIDNATQFYKSDDSTGGHSYYYHISEDYSIKEFSHDFGAFDPSVAICAGRFDGIKKRAVKILLFDTKNQIIEHRHIECQFGAS